jgi:hypothetical protein
MSGYHIKLVERAEIAVASGSVVVALAALQQFGLFRLYLPS